MAIFFHCKKKVIGRNAAKQLMTKKLNQVS